MRDVSLATIERLLDQGCTIEKSDSFGCYRVVLPSGCSFSQINLKNALLAGIEYFEPLESREK